MPCLNQGDSSVNHATLVDLPAFLYTLITELLPQGRLVQCMEFTYKKQKREYVDADVLLEAERPIETR